MCFEIPFKIVSIKGKKATIDCFGHQSEVSLVLINDIKVGDYVIAKGGCAISKIEKKEAREIINLLENKNKENNS